MPGRLDLLLANRAYADHETPPEPGTPLTAGAGGLISAVRPVVEPWDGDTGTTWIGAGRGHYDRDYVDRAGIELLATTAGPLRQKRLFFDDETWAGHYGVTANGFLWPLLHLAHAPLPELVEEFPAPASPGDPDREAYERVNEAFAAAAMEVGGANCWINDYQLAIVPERLRERGFSGRIGFFLHTPFPDLGIAERFLDERGVALLARIVNGILGADLAGFQTEGDAARFRDAATRLACAAADGDGLRLAGRRVAVGAFPVGIDVAATEAAAREGRLSEGIERREGVPLVVGLERADYTKGVPERLGAIAAAYRSGRRFDYAGFASPTREGAAAYGELGDVIATAGREAERAATQAGCRFHQSQRALPWEQVVALLREADVVFTSSLADGMNLVPLQAAVAQTFRTDAARGTVIAGSGAGVAGAFADCLGDGLSAVDALDAGAMTETLGAALDGRLAPIGDRFVAAVRTRDARRWGEGFLAALEATE